MNMGIASRIPLAYDAAKIAMIPGFLANASAARPDTADTPSVSDGAMQKQSPDT
jgi:hypothetical protein